MTSSLENLLSSWTGASSSTEQDKQERTERMIRDAVGAHQPFGGCNLSVYAKGSYPNNTNVRTDSDVDIAVQCHNVFYWDEEEPSAHPAVTPYDGIWTPTKLRTELASALRAKFGNQVDDSGSTAFRIKSGTARVDADVIPCSDYRYYLSSGGYIEGCRIYRKNGVGFENYPVRHLEYGVDKNSRTRTRFKKAVRILKRVENAMLENEVHREVQSFFIESLVYNCPDSIINKSTWVDTISGILVHVWNSLEGDEPSESSERWREVNGFKYLFHPDQKWTRADGRDFAYAAWNYLGCAE
jgi:hypothetical protein